MTDDRIKQLFQIADRTAGRPIMFPIKTSAIRRKARIRRAAVLTSRIAAAVLIIFVLAVWGLSDRTTEPPVQQEQDKIAVLQNEVELLQAKVDAAYELVQEVLETERRRARLEELQTQLANIPDALEEIQKEVERAAFVIVYAADRMYHERNAKSSALQAYKRVVELFPKTQSAEVARQRLAEIENTESEKQFQKEI